MKLKSSTLIAAMVLSNATAYAATDSMANMPTIQPKKSYAVSSSEAGEELQAQRGFGEQEPMVRMMNLMMVEGSGMEGMDMGSMKMAANDTGQRPDPSSMAGMNMSGGKDSAPKVTNSQNPDSLKYEMKATPEKPKVGTNTIDISILDSGKPAKGLLPKAKVYMTSMDMGTEEPKVKEVSPGKYRVKVAFAMKGPWAVKLTTNGEEKEFQFNVGDSK
jgi:hypothetical protein